MRKIQQINGKFLYSFWERKELYALSFFVCASHQFSHKTFTSQDFPKLSAQISRSDKTIYRLIDKCVKLGLILKDKEKYTLLSNNKIHEKYGGKYRFSAYVPEDILNEGVRSVYDFLRSIPILANIRSQEIRAAKKKRHDVQTSM